jgi:hypothetical protein
MAGTEAFQFDAERVPVGAVYHYEKSNADGSHPERVSLYVADRGTIETFKFRLPRPTSASRVVAAMDWERFSAERLDSWQMARFSGDRHVATAEYSPVARTLSLQIEGLPRHTVVVRHLPLHVYSFDLASLNVAFRFLRDPKGFFTIGIANPTYAARGSTIAYNGEATIQYVADEAHEGTACRKYRIDGEGLDGHGGVIWVNSAEGHIVDMQIGQPNHPDYRSFRLKLLGRESMKPDAWQDFKRSWLDQQ